MRNLLSSRRPLVALAFNTLALVACGGGGDGGALVTDTPQPEATALAARPSSSYAGRCDQPRYGDPYNDRDGSLALEKEWVRRWIDETYLWYREVPKTSPSDFDGPVDYFDELKTKKLTASGQPKDRFHFSYATKDWVAASKGESLGYGMEVALLASYPPRRAVIAFTEPGTAAAAKSIRRGAEILKIDGVDLVRGHHVDTLNAGLMPDRAGESHTFVIRDLGSKQSRSVKLKASVVKSRPVQNVKVIEASNGKVGYLQFNDHIAPAEAQLVSAVRSLRKQGPLKDLVLDIRYNGGGLLRIASELAYMIAGPVPTRGEAFEKLVFNDKNPFDLSSAQATTPFFSTTRGPSTTSGQALPTLNLKRVIVLTGKNTCSASEAIINGLRGVGVEVIQIGATTCGKPYGFYPAENCGTTYFAIQFRGVNAKGFGDYTDGFVPAGKGRNGVLGCVVGDDFKHALGNRAEARLAAALNYSATGSCKGTSALPGGDSFGKAAEEVEAEPVLLRSELRENRFYD